MYQEKITFNDTMFHFLALETINYILSKPIETKQKSLVTYT